MRRRRRAGSRFAARRRRPRRPSRSYTLAHLLAKQPKTITKQPEYPALLRRFRDSPRLKALRISRRCYTLLNNARVAPHNLHHFYRTYHLPKDEYFPLFVAAKRGYLAERRRIKEARRQYILARVRELPPQVLASIRYLGYLERAHNGADQSPVWQSELFPSSKKRANELHRLCTAEWHALYKEHLALLSDRYRRLPETLVDRVLACCVLEILPHDVDRMTVPPAAPRNAVVRSYRRLSLLHHPDCGGDPAVFIEIKRARDTLLGP